MSVLFVLNVFHISHHTLTERHVHGNISLEHAQIESKLHSIRLLIVITFVIIIVDDEVGAIRYIDLDVVESSDVVWVSQNFVPGNTLNCFHRATDLVHLFS